jgi:hypothetical protein
MKKAVIVLCKVLSIQKVASIPKSVQQRMEESELFQKAINLLRGLELQVITYGITTGKIIGIITGITIGIYSE